MTLPKTADVIIIGGGVMGASTAYYLTERGIKNVLLLEMEESFGQGATGRCAGGVRYQFATEVNIKLSLESLPILDNFKDMFGQVVDYKHVGYLFLLTDPDSVKKFQQNVNLQHSLGVNTEWLSGDEVRSRFPLMNLDDVIAATNHEKDGVVDPNGVVMGYINSSKRLGARALNNVEVLAIIAKSGHVTGVKTNQGIISSPVVVNAAGPWAGVVGKMAGLSVPIQPLRRQWLTTGPLPELPQDFPFMIDFSQSLYFHPEGEGLLTGMSNPAEKFGFDQNIDRDWELVHIQAAIDRFPLLSKAGLSSHLAGLYEVTPDAHPIISGTSVEGFYVVAGFSGHGFMHGPAAGICMSEIIIDGKSTTVDVSMLDLDRFEEDRLIYEYNVI
ncbi:MAG: FAD-binding oxidoreductase [Chloroflexi bacterium]|nr:MAG: FAD-binding oxidoreductase [Chloroflexota bacterium]